MRAIKVIERGKERSPWLRWYYRGEPRYRKVRDSRNIDEEIYRLRRDLELGDGVPPRRAGNGAPALGDLLSQWHEEVLTHASRKQADALVYAVRRILTEANIKGPNQITLGKVRRAIHRLKCKPKKAQKDPPTLSERTRHRYSRHVKQFTAWLVREKHIETDPLQGWKLQTVRTERNPRDRLQPEEFGKLIQYVFGSTNRIEGMGGEERGWLYLLAATTGLRRGELASLTQHSFDFQKRVIAVKRAYTKNGEFAVLPIHSEICEGLQTWVPRRPGKLFPGLSDKTTARMLRIDLKRAGVPYETHEGVRCFHSLRNTFISSLFDLGTNLATVQRLARHSDPRLTMKYSKATSDEGRVVDAIRLPSHGPSHGKGQK